jgi:sulfatase modifying factor 1
VARPDARRQHAHRRRRAGLRPGHGVHELILTHDFVIAEVETSQGDFDTVMGYNPSLGNSYCNKPKWDLCPVNQVTWNEAVKYCNELSGKEGLTQCFTCTGSGSTTSCSPLPQYAGQSIYLCPGYRLPTEAEWEHAARAGWDTALYTGVDLTVVNCDDGADTALDPIAYYAANAGYTYHPSGEKNPNGWGLYDMLGNMEEWVYDTYWTSLGAGQKVDPAVTTGGTGKVRKGGAFDQGPRAQRSGHRAAYTPIMFNDDLGFRCARTL